jgi:hypothetical protein
LAPDQVQVEQVFADLIKVAKDASGAICRAFKVSGKGVLSDLLSWHQDQNTAHQYHQTDSATFDTTSA